MASRQPDASITSRTTDRFVDRTSSNKWRLLPYLVRALPDRSLPILSRYLTFILSYFLLVRCRGTTSPARHRNKLTPIENDIVRLPSWVSSDRLTPRRRHSLTILHRLLEEVVAARNATLPAIRDCPKSAAMIIGSLGAGGAERQLVATSRGIFNKENQVFADLKVIVQSCRSR
ncbi:MAG: hypothetical protein ACRD9W_24825, partial [Terriglobia bacterium]